MRIGALALVLIFGGCAQLEAWGEGGRIIELRDACAKAQSWQQALSLEFMRLATEPERPQMDETLIDEGEAAGQFALMRCQRWGKVPAGELSIGVRQAIDEMVRVHGALPR